MFACSRPVRQSEKARVARDDPSICRCYEVVNEYDVVVVGAGQVGLSAAYALAKAGLDRERYVVLDANPGPVVHRLPPGPQPPRHAARAALDRLRYLAG